MSNILINAVMASGLPPTQRHVAMVLASRTDDKIGYCWPSVQTIADDTGLGERAVQKSIRAMTQSGALRIEVIHRNKTNRYYLSPNPRPKNTENNGSKGAPRSPLEGEQNALPRVHDVHPQGARRSPSGCTTFTPKGAPRAPETKGNKRETKGESPPPDSDELEMEWESTLSDDMKAAWGKWCKFRIDRSVNGTVNKRRSWTPGIKGACIEAIQTALSEHTESEVITGINRSIMGDHEVLRFWKARPDHKPGSTNRSRPRSIPQGEVREHSPEDFIRAARGSDEDIQEEQALRDQFKIA